MSIVSRALLVQHDEAWGGDGVAARLHLKAEVAPGQLDSVLRPNARARKHFSCWRGCTVPTSAQPYVRLGQNSRIEVYDIALHMGSLIKGLLCFIYL